MLGLCLLVPMSLNFLGDMGEGKNRNCIVAKLWGKLPQTCVYVRVPVPSKILFYCL